MGRPIERMRPAPVTTATLPSSPERSNPLMPGSLADAGAARSAGGAEPLGQRVDAMLLGLAATELAEHPATAAHHRELPLLAASGLQLHRQRSGIEDRLARGPPPAACAVGARVHQLVGPDGEERVLGTELAVDPLHEQSLVG